MNRGRRVLPLFAASVAPDDSPSGQDLLGSLELSSRTDLQSLRLIRASEVAGQLREARSRANGGEVGGWMGLIMQEPFSVYIKYLE